MEAGVTCLVALMAGLMGAVILTAALYPWMGPHGLGFGVLIGFPTGIIVGLCARTFRSKS